LLRPSALAFPVYRFRFLQTTAGSSFKVLDAQIALTKGDTARARRAFGEIGAGRQFAAPFDITFDALYPEASLLADLGQQKAAIDWLDPTLTTLPLGAPQTFIDPENAGALVRAMALRAELAEHFGDTEAAARWANAVVILWQGSDSFLQPAVERMVRLAKRQPSRN